MIIKKENRKIVVFGYGDIIVASRAEKGKGYTNIYHANKRLDIGETPGKDADVKAAPEVQLRFDNIESLDVLIGQLKRMRKRINKQNKKIYSYDIEWKPVA